MSAEGRVTRGRDDDFQRQIFYRRDGAVIFRCHGKTGQQRGGVTVGRGG